MTQTLEYLVEEPKEISGGLCEVTVGLFTDTNRNGEVDFPDEEQIGSYEDVVNCADVNKLHPSDYTPE